ncbi:MAG: DUF6220 domain-containing protein [Bacillota bacterium]
MEIEKKLVVNGNGQNIRKELPASVRNSRVGYSVLAWILVVCIIVQVFIAGMAVFENPLNWGRHTSFVHLFELVPIIMFILGFLGRLPKGMIWGSFGLFALIFIQYATAHGILPALHPVIALLLFGWAFILACRSNKMVFGRDAN